MKILKLIGFMLLTANFVAAQNTYSAPDPVSGNQNTIIGVDAGTKPTIGNNNVGIGFRAMELATGTSNTCIGYQAGRKLTTNNNVFLGINAGWEATGGTGNVGIGQNALKTNTSGKDNFALGNNAGIANKSGESNVFLGAFAGHSNVSGVRNAYIGDRAGSGQKGSFNVAIGDKAGKVLAANSSDYNVFIGANAGKNKTANDSHELYIQNQDPDDTNTTPLLYGQFPHVDAGGTQQEGRLAINYDRFPLATDGNPYTLAVNGKTITEEVKVMVETTWPDYVFAKDYNLMSLTDLEAQIGVLGHLPGVPSAKEVEENGHELGQMDAILLEKVEELTLHLIEMDKTIKRLEKVEQELRKENEALRK